MSASIVLGVSLIIALLLGIPIAFAIGLATLAALLVSGIPTAFLAQGAFTALDSFPLMAVPFFILAGALMETGGLSRRIINVASRSFGNITGGFAIVTILACMFFAAISGSSPATVAAIGSIMIPAMVKRGYDKNFAAATAGAGGGMGILIPPSIPMIIYGVVANVSIGDMFLAGFGPGLLVGLLLMLTAYWRSKRKGFVGTGEKFRLDMLLSAIWDAKWALLAPIIILGGIYGGIFTPTESAVVAVVYGLIIGLFVYKELKWKDIPKTLISAAMITGSVMIILGTATAFGKLATMLQIPNQMAEIISSISTNKLVILMLINLLILIVGTFMETLSIIIILAPLFLPILLNLGVNPVHFGILLVMGAEIGMMTPPLGVNLFVASGISGQSLENVAKAIVPYVLALVVAVIVVTFIPQIALFLPEWIASLRAD